MTPPRTAIVIGAGIGGLAAAIALTERGCKVTVLERDSQLDASGAAVRAIWPNGTRALERLGLRELVQLLAAKPISAVIRKADGTPMVEHQAQALHRRYGAPLVAVRREELLQAEYGGLGRGSVLFDCPSGLVRKSCGTERGHRRMPGADAGPDVRRLGRAGKGRLRPSVLSSRSRQRPAQHGSLATLIPNADYEVS